MAPIRTAIIGLSSSAKTSWASSAHLPYLLSAAGVPKTRAYGDPEALAKDADVDFVVDVTRVDVHHPTILPSVKAGKAVYVEWPLAQDEEHVKELVEAARKSGSPTVVGVQGRLAPIVLKLRELVHSGRIGKVLSSEIRGAGGSMDRQYLSPGLKYFTQRAIGGNVFTIGFGHLFDQIQHVLGELKDLKGHVQLQRPDVKLRDPSTKKIVETVKSDVPDLIIATGSLAASETAQKDATVLYRFRRGQPFKGEPALVWTINGEKGEIRLVVQGGTTLHANAYGDAITLEVQDFATDEVEPVEWKWNDWQEELPGLSRSVAAVYDRYAEGHGKGLPSFEDAFVRHQQLGQILGNWVAEN
ncbi:hypothetical protein G7046_g1250 [Stylonectria norvegica]|nr:hypothetical protein G7046_g1250 [Stylonectria norvegica]